MKNSKTSLFPIILSLVMMIPLLGISQGKRVISIGEVQNEARENNDALRLSAQDYKMARAQYQSTMEVLLPKLKVTNTSSFTNNPLHAFGFKLLQREVTAADFDPDLLNDPGDVENFNTRIELQQPLINVDGWKQRSSMNMHMKMSELQRQRQQEYVELEVSKTFMELQLAYRAVEVLEKARLTAMEHQKVAKDQLDLGLMQHADYLNLEVHLSDIENQLTNAKSGLANVSEYLAFLIGDKSGQLLAPESELMPGEAADAFDATLNMERKDLQMQDLALEAQKKMLSSSKLSFVPRANAMAAYEWNDSEFMGFGADNYLVGIQLSWDLFSGYKNISKIQREKAMMDKTEIQREKYLSESELELQKAKRQLDDAREKIKVSNLALEQSGEALRIKTDRYEEGLEKTSDLLFVETQYLEQEMNYYQSVFQYNYALEYLKFLTR